MPFEYSVKYIGNKYDTDKPWAVNRPGGMSYYKKKANAEAHARELAKNNQGHLKVYTKRGTVSTSQKYYDNDGGGSSSGFSLPGF